MVIFLHFIITTRLDKTKSFGIYLPGEDQFERKEFNDWCLQGVKNMVDDLEYFGDRFKMTRVAVFVVHIM